MLIADRNNDVVIAEGALRQIETSYETLRSGGHESLGYSASPKLSQAPAPAPAPPQRRLFKTGRNVQIATWVLFRASTTLYSLQCREGGFRSAWPI